MTYQYNTDGLRTFKWANNQNHYYYYDGDRLIAEKLTTGYLLFHYDENDSIYSITYNNGTTSTKYYLYKNLQGDVVQIRNIANGVVANYSYDAWGNIVSITDGYGNDLSNSTNTFAAINPIRYRGYYYDTETGFYYLQSRYYDPAISRFISADDPAFLGAVDNPASLNLFAYCMNNPVNMGDDSGYLPQFMCDIGNGIADGFIDTFKGIGNTICHPIATAKSVVNSVVDDSLGALANHAINIVDPFKLGRITYSAATGDFYGAGYLYGGNLADASIVAGSALAGKAIGNAISRSGKIEIGKIKGVRAPAGYPGIRYKTKAGPAYSVELHGSHNGHTPHLQINKWLYQYKRYEGEPYRFKSWHFEFLKPWKGIY